jgi:small-conductance mechanosensitive channel
MVLALPALAGELRRSPDAPTAQTPSAAEHPVVVLNRTIVTFRAAYYGVSAQERARRASIQIRELLTTAPAGKVSVSNTIYGVQLLVDGALVFIITPDDADRLKGETIDQTAAAAAASLERVLLEGRELHSTRILVQAVGLSLAGSVAALLLLIGAVRVRRRVARRLVRLQQRHPQRLRYLSWEAVVSIVRWMSDALFFATVLLIVYQWLGFVLTLFPYTRPWGERLRGYLLEVFLELAVAALRALPDLMIAVLIFALARIVVRLVRPFFDRVERGYDTVGWLDSETVLPTRRIATGIIWLFALVMAYPYIPGAHTEAFRGLSVLVGLMISLGASSVVGQAASGLILIYTRTLRSGEYVRIGEHEGTVVELGMFATRIRSGLGEELTLPNSLVMANVTRNYSRLVEEGEGYIVHTAVTIGYDVPWRQVHAMLIEAARRTPKILASPAPQVFQTALSDFSVEYRLAAQAVAVAARNRAEVMTNLHANVQDVFNEHGVQIMSPHYLTDPATPKVVPPEHWHAAPAVASKEPK